MTTVVAIHDVDRNSGHYAAVRDYMREHGAPTIRCYESNLGYLVALEGSRRLAVAAELGESVDLEIVDVDTDADLAEFGYGFADAGVTVDSLTCGSFRGRPMYDVDDDGNVSIDD